MMLKQLNQGGQSFSVFKLLIAAVVAIVILTILLQILNSLNIIGQGDPNEESASKIKTLLSSPGAPSKTQAVTFAPESTMVAKTIASKTKQLSAAQVCLSAGEFDEEEFELAGDGRFIRFNGRTPKTVKINVICDYGEELENDPDLEEFFGEYPSECGCPEDEMCCIAMLVPDR